MSRGVAQPRYCPVFRCRTYVPQRSRRGPQRSRRGGLGRKVGYHVWLAGECRQERRTASPAAFSLACHASRWFDGGYALAGRVFGRTPRWGRGGAGMASQSDRVGGNGHGLGRGSVLRVDDHLVVRRLGTLQGFDRLPGALMVSKRCSASRRSGGEARTSGPVVSGPRGGGWRPGARAGRAGPGAGGATPAGAGGAGAGRFLPTADGLPESLPVASRPCRGTLPLVRSRSSREGRRWRP
jgi:hypothetical protein